jgi:hypothetical protein
MKYCKRSRCFAYALPVAVVFLPLKYFLAQRFFVVVNLLGVILFLRKKSFKTKSAKWKSFKTKAKKQKSCSPKNDSI